MQTGDRDKQVRPTNVTPISPKQKERDKKASVKDPNPGMVTK